ncbi:MAG: benzoyl-CoA reductase subunit D [Tetrasphaera sp.]
MTTTIGIDIGAGAAKTVLFEVGDDTRWLGRQVERIRQRDPYRLAGEAVDRMLAEHGITREDVDYIATTGDADGIEWSTGHFYSMTTHARGAIYLQPDAVAVLDVGALHGRAIHIDPRGKVLASQMTSQCASGSGQFLENIARYLGIAQDEIGLISLEGQNPEKVSSICAVLAETDVINMVSRGIAAPDILRGIHLSMAGRLTQLIRRLKLRGGTVLVTGGLGLDPGLIGALQNSFAEAKIPLQVASHDDAIYAGAIGAALWAAFRHDKLAAQRVPLAVGSAS